MVDFSKLLKPQKQDRIRTNAEHVKDGMIGKDLQGELLRHLGKVFAETMLDCGIARTCLNCDHWNTDGSYGKSHMHDKRFPEGCKKFQRLPPPKIIVVGCEHHTDQIPF